ncbi:MAG: MotA/TolQ/ExbB proton channel family protein [Cytophagaceae bacterium]|jgi:biopolymer transport protein ExbB|nr:MotA/TolQ/ExbB proton channel family protein [Cytophagaceae bacterium]
MFFQLLQLVATAETQSVAADKSVSILDLALKGGWVMIPIAACSIVAVYIICERLLTLKKSNKDPVKFIEKIKTMVYEGDIKGALVQCKEFDTPFSRMVEKGISKIGTPIQNIEASIENVAKMEVYKLERNVSILATMAGLGPMLGFFGTVTGMVNAFIAIAQVEGAVTPGMLANGMYEAMVTTVAGLIVGIIALVGYNIIIARIDSIVQKMEYSSIEFLELLQQPK